MILPGKETQEKRQHSTVYIPYSFYECNLPHSFMNVPMHWHSEFELNYVVEGTGEFTCGGGLFTASRGDLLILPPNMLHAAYPRQGSGLYYYALVFSPAILGMNVHDRCTMEYILPLISGTRRITPHLSARLKNHARLEACAKQIFSCVTDHVPFPDLLLKSELLRLFWLLETDEEALCQKETDADYGECIRPALEYMMKNFHKNITVSQLAALTHLSQSYFMSCFKKAVGLGSIEYLSQLRINAACEALSSTEKKISEIAFACGYENLSNFNRHFKKSTGRSPSEYRRHGRAPLKG